jgi:cysteine desulfurase
MKQDGVQNAKPVYLDNAATTAVDPEVLEAMLPYFIEASANPSSLHIAAKRARDACNAARHSIAHLINAKDEEIFFTSGGSESDNWALKSIAYMQKSKGNHIIVTKIEHHAIINTCKFLEKNGIEVTYLDVDKYGRVDPKNVERAIRPGTILISVMFANNEIGTIEPIKEIGAIAKKHGILFHTDAVQAFGQIPIDVNEMNIDLLSASGHKVYGPKGVGVLYIRKGIRMEPLIHGGAQEWGQRAGTSNVPGIVGMGKAAEIAERDMSKKMAHEIKIRDHVIGRILSEIPYSSLNGHRTERLPGNVNTSFQFVEGESVLMSMSQKGICVSTGSACASGSLDPSHVLLAIGLPHEGAHGSIRITISSTTTFEEVDYAVDVLKASVERLRSLSPLYDDFVKKEVTKDV